MKIPMINICYCPTTVTLIDDNEKYLKHLKSELTHAGFSCLAYNDPKKAVDFLTKKYQANPFTQRCLSTADNYLVDRFATTFDERKIFQEIYNPKRMAEISVIVVDYAMSGMNGIEFCRYIREKKLPFKLIMLTGEAGQDLAVKAFNEGIIDKFFLKDTDDLMDELTDGIRQMQESYFLDLSATVLNAIDADANKTFSLLNDPVFADFFLGLRNKYKVVEYYLLDEWGSFLLLDIDANPIWVLVTTDQGMEAAYDFAHYDNSVPRDVLDALKRKNGILFLHDTMPGDNWREYLHPAKELKGGLQTYYHAVVTDPTVYPLDQKKLLSSRSYLKTA